MALLALAFSGTAELLVVNDTLHTRPRQGDLVITAAAISSHTAEWGDHYMSKGIVSRPLLEDGLRYSLPARVI